MKNALASENYIIYGKHPVYEAIKSGIKLKEIWLLDSNAKQLEKLVTLCKLHNIPYFFKNYNELKTWIEKSHQGVIGFLSKNANQFFSLEEFFDNTTIKTPSFFILLDSITDPRNFGAILRNCDCFNITGVITSKDRSAPVTPVVYKTSSGAIAYVPLIRVKNLVRSIKTLKEKGSWIYGLDIEGERFLSQCDFKGNIGIVIGSEGKGMRELVKKSCDFLVKIENMGHVDSLNVSVASGIAMYEVLKQRKGDRTSSSCGGQDVREQGNV